MNLLILILISALSTHAQRDIPAIADIEWKCEEGVGNLENPRPLLLISGKFDTTSNREFSLAEKQELQVTVYTDSQPIILDPSEYSLEWFNDGHFQSLTIQYGETTYKIGTTPGNALILEITRPGMIWGTETEVGSC